MLHCPPYCTCRSCARRCVCHVNFKNKAIWLVIPDFWEWNVTKTEKSRASCQTCHGYISPGDFGPGGPKSPDIWSARTDLSADILICPDRFIWWVKEIICCVNSSVAIAQTDFRASSIYSILLTVRATGKADIMFALQLHNSLYRLMTWSSSVLHYTINS